ncbi:MAG: UbiA-like polyprenyltransferase [Nitrospinota bacterium]
MARASLLLRMVKFEHTVFALPFAVMGGFLAAGGVPRPWVFFWVIMAAVGARNFAMALNRLADRELDERNPRTQDRRAFRGILYGPGIWLFMGGCLALFFLSAAMLNPLALYLSPLVIAVIILYAYSKRFTSLCHLILGLALGFAPAGGWVAVAGGLALTPILLLVGVTLWVAGFDIIYGCLDYDFDGREGLHSIPRRLGLRGALILSGVLHAGTALCFFLVGQLASLGLIYYLGTSAASGLLVLEHILVSPGDLSRVNFSFFNLNALVSLLVGGAAVVDLLLPLA